MSLSSANLRGAVFAPKLSAADAERLRYQWTKVYSETLPSVRLLEPGWKFAPAPLDDDLYAVMCKAQDRFKAPHLRWDWCHRPPFPFRWGPNGPFFLLLAMLAAYALIVALVNWSAA